jgi:hypothetical protein
MQMIWGTNDTKVWFFEIKGREKTLFRIKILS